MPFPPPGAGRHPTAGEDAGRERTFSISGRTVQKTLHRGPYPTQDERMASESAQSWEKGLETCEISVGVVRKPRFNIDS